MSGVVCNFTIYSHEKVVIWQDQFLFHHHRLGLIFLGFDWFFSLFIAAEDEVLKLFPHLFGILCLLGWFLVLWFSFIISILRRNVKTREIDFGLLWLAMVKLDEIVEFHQALIFTISQGFGKDIGVILANLPQLRSILFSRERCLRINEILFGVVL
jgi:hypothetical protein